MKLQSERFATGKGSFAYLPYAELLRVVRHTEGGKIPHIRLDETEELPSLVLVRSEVDVIQLPTEANNYTAIAKARLTLEDADGKQYVFEDYGECTGAILLRKMGGEGVEPRTIRMAVTRAKNRALRDALGVDDEEFSEGAPVSLPSTGYTGERRSSVAAPSSPSASASNSDTKDLLKVQQEFAQRCHELRFKQSPGIAMKYLLQYLDKKEEVSINFNNMADLKRCLALSVEEWRAILSEAMATPSDGRMPKGAV